LHERTRNVSSRIQLTTTFLEDYVTSREFDLEVGSAIGSVSAIFHAPDELDAVYVFAHGAGANMRHAFMQSLADQLADQRIATLRYNFPYMQTGRKRPDPPDILEATVRAAIDRACALAQGKSVIAGGKSMGGRMTSQALAKQHDPRVRGIVFFGFPLHQPGKPSTDRAAHLAAVRVPMLFLQGTRDSLAQLDLIRQVCASLGARTTLHIIDGADHSFAVLKRTGMSNESVRAELAVTVSNWLRKL
jgi:predicted alpha/beta-hydrolase family hydrolase